MIGKTSRVPKDYEEAARMVGASVLRSFGRSSCDATPAIATLVTIQFSTNGTTSSYPLSVTSQRNCAPSCGWRPANANRGMAGRTLAALPSHRPDVRGLHVFQKYFVRGIATSG